MMYTINHKVLLCMRNDPIPTHQHFKIAIKFRTLFNIGEYIGSIWWNSMT